MKIINKGGKYNFQDDTGRIISKKWFNNVTNFYNGFSLVQIINPIIKLNNDTYLINENGNIIKKFKKVKFDNLLESYVYDNKAKKYKLVYKIDDFGKQYFINFDTFDIEQYDDRIKFIDKDDYKKILYEKEIENKDKETKNSLYNEMRSKIGREIEGTNYIITDAISTEKQLLGRNLIKVKFNNKNRAYIFKDKLELVKISGSSNFIIDIWQEEIIGGKHYLNVKINTGKCFYIDVETLYPLKVSGIEGVVTKVGNEANLLGKKFVDIEINKRKIIIDSNTLEKVKLKIPGTNFYIISIYDSYNLGTSILKSHPIQEVKLNHNNQVCINPKTLDYIKVNGTNDIITNILWTKIDILDRTFINVNINFSNNEDFIDVDTLEKVELIDISKDFDGLRTLILDLIEKLSSYGMKLINTEDYFYLLKNFENTKLLNGDYNIYSNKIIEILTIAVKNKFYSSVINISKYIEENDIYLYDLMITDYFALVGASYQEEGDIENSERLSDMYIECIDYALENDSDFYKNYKDRLSGMNIDINKKGVLGLMLYVRDLGELGLSYKISKEEYDKAHLKNGL